MQGSLVFVVKVVMVVHLERRSFKMLFLFMRCREGWLYLQPQIWLQAGKYDVQEVLHKILTINCINDIDKSAKKSPIMPKVAFLKIKIFPGERTPFK